MIDSSKLEGLGINGNRPFFRRSELRETAMGLINSVAIKAQLPPETTSVEVPLVSSDGKTYTVVLAGRTDLIYPQASITLVSAAEAGDARTQAIIELGDLPEDIDCTTATAAEAILDEVREQLYR